MSRAFTVDVTALSVRHRVYLFEDGAAHALHPDAQGQPVTEPSTELHHLQLSRVLYALQRHHQESIDTGLEEQVRLLLQSHHVFIESV